MQDRSGGLVAGIAALPGTPQAIATRLLSGHTGKAELYTQAFLLPAVDAINAPQSLVLPVGWFQPSRVIEIYPKRPYASVSIISFRTAPISSASATFWKSSRPRFLKL